MQAAGIEKVRIRSVLTCEAQRGVCALCYGRDLATGKLVEMGLAVGVIAAQSIGEPGTQLTMRTFHIGGTASHTTQQTTLEAKNAGTVKFHNLTTVKNKKGDLVVMNRSGALIVHDQKGRERERHAVVYGAKLKVKEGSEVKQGQLLVEWDPYSFTILTEEEGHVSFKDILDGQTVHEQVDENTGMAALVIMESPDEKKQPRIEIKDEKGKTQKKYLLPSGAHLMVEDGSEVAAGDVLAKIPRETAKTKDITGGLPRVVELFEARRPKEPAVITEVDGVVKYGDVAKQHRKIFVTGEDEQAREYQLPRGAHINVQEGERVKAGEPLMDGPIDPHDILKVRGEKELQRYLVDEIQEVYRLQGVNINDKHIEVIVRQMMRWMKVEDVGDTEFLIDEVVDKFRFRSENEKVAQGQRSAGHRQPAAPRDHQGVALHRLLHLGRELPGDDAGAHRGRDQRQGRPPAGPQGERDHGPAHPRRHGDGVLPEDQDPGGGRGAARRAASRAATRPSTWSSPSTSRKAPRSSRVPKRGRLLPTSTTGGRLPDAQACGRMPLRDPYPCAS